MTDPFWSKVATAGNDDCWEWQGARNRKGYGNFRSRSAHVVAYEMERGSVPSGLTIDHLCRNHACVNPAHLEAVTPQENTRRHWALKTHCIRGHELSGDNVVLVKRKDGTRRKCKECNRLYKRKEYANG